VKLENKKRRVETEEHGALKRKESAAHTGKIGDLTS